MKKVALALSVVQALYWLTPASRFNIVEAATLDPAATVQAQR